MRKFGPRSAATSLLMAGVLAGLPIAVAGPAVAAVNGTLPFQPQTCAAGQPKLDYEYTPTGTQNAPFIWSNVCGTGTWNWSAEGTLYVIRMPTSPTHRVWMHIYDAGTGQTLDTYCFWSPNQDLYVDDYPPPTDWQNPSDIQVSDNTTHC